MALIDLSLITSALIKLLEENINQIDNNANVSVTPEPPDKVGSVTNKLSLHMYHVSEEAFYKNFEGPGGADGRNIARTPMGLCLYYILTAHHESAQPELDPLTQQRMMGYALKTLHDYPLIVDDTEINGQPILPLGLAGADNPVQVIMRPVAPEDSVAFWGAEDQRTARLSAYYEVRVILLEPDPPTTAVAPVLSLGTYLFQLGAPHLESTRNELPFTLPASAGGGTQLVTASPARATAVAGQNPVQNRVEFTGQNLAGGVRRQLWLRGAQFTATVGGPLPIDLALPDNVLAGWSLSVATDKLTLELAATLTYLDAQGGQATIDLLPGIYSAFLRITVQDRLVGDTLVPMTNDSNEVTLVVIPRILSSSVDTQTDYVTLTIVDTFDLLDASLSIQLFCDGQRYVAGALATAGNYSIASGTELTFHANFITADPGDHAVRLIVNGAESAPYWVQT